MFSSRVRQPFADIKELIMGVIAWILLGLVSGLLAQLLLPGGNAQGRTLTCVTCVCGALGSRLSPGGDLPARLPRAHRSFRRAPAEGK